MHEYLIALGANLGDREYYMEQAIEAIRTSCGPILRRAPFIETAPMGAADQPFLNSAVICSCKLEPSALLDRLMAIEKELGRTRDIRWGNRTIDCDIILWRRPPNDYPLMQTAQLVIPHPEALNRAFVLEPSAAIAGEWRHPTVDRTLAELWQDWQDTRSV
jgi:2-amino-4-hydroxy-6-hydroxymethyldihydropteridine diphosphokinase